MFRPRPETRRPTVSVTVEGRPIAVPVGASAAAAVLAAGKVRTPDLGGSSSTEEVTTAVLEKLG